MKRLAGNQHGVRRDCCRCTMRRESHRDAPGPRRGPRVARGPPGMLLARAGCRVLLVDRAAFPSDTNSTHCLTTQGVVRLQRWGLLDALKQSGCPPTRWFVLDFGSIVLRAIPQPIDGLDSYYSPRRRVLDEILVAAAGRAGVELRERFKVTELLFNGSRVVGIRGRTAQGTTVEERAHLTI